MQTPTSRPEQSAGTVNTPAPSPAHLPRPSFETSKRKLARAPLTVLTLTFLAARILVLLIMTRRIPDLFLNLGGTHVHHLNYGIILLAACALLLFYRPVGRAAAAIFTRLLLETLQIAEKRVAPALQRMEAESPQ